MGVAQRRARLLVAADDVFLELDRLVGQIVVAECRRRLEVPVEVAAH